MRFLRKARALPALLLALILPGRAGAALWVSSSGSDSNPGTEEAPLASLARAQAAVRAMNRDMGDDITVFLSGEFRLSEPLRFGPEDSGSNGFNIIYTAAPDSHPTISGAIRVEGWSVAERSRNLWAAEVPDSLAEVPALFVNGSPCSRTRGRLLPAFSRDSGGDEPQTATPGATWRNPSDVVFRPAGEMSIWSERKPQAPLFVENAYELLGHPGEWYFDRKARRIFYTPRAGEVLTTSNVEVPLSRALVAIQGSGDRPVSGLIFKGIRFQYAQGGSESAASAARAGGIQFIEDEFIHLGGTALSIGPGISSVRVEGCVFGDSAGSALRIVGSNSVQVSDSRITYPSTGDARLPAVDVDSSREVVLQHCQIDHYPERAVSEEGPAGMVSLQQTAISEPMVRFHGPGPSLPRPSGDAGISPDYRSLLDFKVVQTWTPGAPTDVSAEPEEGYALVTWMPPALDGGSPIATYTVQSSSGASLAVPADDFMDKGYVVFPGLGDDKRVTFTVSASNALGASEVSLPSAPIAPGRKRRFRSPQAPAAVVATEAGGTVTLVITPPASDGGSPVTGYSVSLPGDGAPIVLQGLDVVHSDASHPLTRTIELPPKLGEKRLSVRALNEAGEGSPFVVRLP